MYVPFEELPDHARVWVYIADSRLSDDEVFALQHQVKDFCDKWEAHKQPVKAWGGILHNLFLVLVADEDFHPVSGCSIDSSVHFIREISKQIGVDFFNRTNIGVFNTDHWEVYPQPVVVDRIKIGEIAPEDKLFNYRVADKAALMQHFSLPVSESWLARHIPQTA